MIPRTKLEKAVAAINATLSESLSESDANWAKKASEKWDMRHYCYFTIYSNIKEWEVKRLYRIYRFNSKSITHWYFVEIIREFNDGEHKLYFAKHRQMGSYFDCFTYSSDIELRGVYRNYAGYILPELFKLSCGSRAAHRGKRVECVGIDPKELNRVINNNPVAENLYKNDDGLFGYLIWQPYAKQVCRAITLAKRHGFQFNGYSTALWFDMVRAMIFCKKDIHNPIFIAPKNLQATHDKFIEMAYRKREREREEKRRRQEELRIQRQIEQIKSQLEKDQSVNEAYIKRRKKFYDMVLTDGLIECRVLRDVQAFADEGLAMAHCVFRCEYYKKVYSLILSARINDERVETIEIDLKNYKILQCYGKHDQFTMYHQRIVDLVNSQMDIIKQYNRSRKQIKIAV